MATNPSQNHLSYPSLFCETPGLASLEPVSLVGFIIFKAQDRILAQDCTRARRGIPMDFFQVGDPGDRVIWVGGGGGMGSLWRCAMEEGGQFWGPWYILA